MISESETAEFNQEKTELANLKAALGGDAVYMRKCVKLLDVFTNKSAIIHWNSAGMH